MIFFLNLQIFFSEFLKKLKANKRNQRHQKEALALFSSYPEGKTDYNNNKQLLIIRVDDIGDYVLFRNFLPFVKSTEKYKDYQVTLLGNSAWKNLSEGLDAPYINQFVWLDKGKFFNDSVYKASFLKELNLNSYDEAWVPTITPSLFLEDFLVYSCCAFQKKGWDTNRNFPIKIYSELVAHHGDDMFMFYWNKLFFENVLSCSISLTQPNIVLSDQVHFLDEKFILIFPGSNAKRKCWNVKNYSKIADYCIQKYGFKVVVAGSKKETKQAAKILSTAQFSNSILDYTGKTNLMELAGLMQSAALLISNDTSGAHFGACIGTKTIVVLNGNNYGRFFPYPTKMKHVKAVFTATFNRKFKAQGQNMFAWSGKTHIDEINPQMIIQEIDELLS